jgi:putative component of membrane protein insertase Oxa1/YidC/SpoIIIJ protein YidD
MIKLLIFLCLCTLVVFPSSAQRANDLARLKQYREQGRIDVTAPTDARTSKTLGFPIRMLFGFYRTTISEQISADCAFDLSCSRFSAAAIDRFGLVKGLLLTGDRLTRCHLFVGQETVPMLFNNRTGKVVDEPSMY